MREVRLSKQLVKHLATNEFAQLTSFYPTLHSVNRLVVTDELDGNYLRTTWTVVG